MAGRAGRQPLGAIENSPHVRQPKRGGAEPAPRAAGEALRPAATPENAADAVNSAAHFLSESQGLTPYLLWAIDAEKCVALQAADASGASSEDLSPSASSEAPRLEAHPDLAAMLGGCDDKSERPGDAETSRSSLGSEMLEMPPRPDQDTSEDPGSVADASMASLEPSHVALAAASEPRSPGPSEAWDSRSRSESRSLVHPGVAAARRSIAGDSIGSQTSGGRSIGEGGSQLGRTVLSALQTAYAIKTPPPLPNMRKRSCRETDTQTDDIDFPPLILATRHAAIPSPAKRLELNAARPAHRRGATPITQTLTGGHGSTSGAGTGPRPRRPRGNAATPPSPKDEEWAETSKVFQAIVAGPIADTSRVHSQHDTSIVCATMVAVDASAASAEAMVPEEETVASRGEEDAKDQSSTSSRGSQPHPPLLIPGCHLSAPSMSAPKPDTASPPAVPQLAPPSVAPEPALEPAPQAAPHQPASEAGPEGPALAGPLGAQLRTTLMPGAAPDITTLLKAGVLEIHVFVHGGVSSPQTMVLNPGTAEAALQVVRAGASVDTAADQTLASQAIEAKNVSMAVKEATVDPSAAETSAVETSVVETSVVETSAVEMSAVETSAVASAPLDAPAQTPEESDFGAEGEEDKMDAREATTDPAEASADPTSFHRSVLFSAAADLDALDDTAAAVAPTERESRNDLFHPAAFAGASQASFILGMGGLGVNWSQSSHLGLRLSESAAMDDHPPFWSQSREVSFQDASFAHHGLPMITVRREKGNPKSARVGVPLRNSADVRLRVRLAVEGGADLFQVSPWEAVLEKGSGFQAQVDFIGEGADADEAMLRIECRPEEGSERKVEVLLLRLKGCAAPPGPPTPGTETSLGTRALSNRERLTAGVNARRSKHPSAPTNPEALAEAHRLLSRWAGMSDTGHNSDLERSVASKKTPHARRSRSVDPRKKTSVAKKGERKLVEDAALRSSAEKVHARSQRRRRRLRQTASPNLGPLPKPAGPVEAESPRVLPRTTNSMTTDLVRVSDVIGVKSPPMMPRLERVPASDIARKAAARALEAFDARTLAGENKEIEADASMIQKIEADTSMLQIITAKPAAPLPLPTPAPSSVRDRSPERPPPALTSSSTSSALSSSSTRGVYFKGSLVRFGRCSVGDMHTAKIELCNSSRSTAIVKLEQPEIPFLILHKKVKLRPRSFVMLPFRFRPHRAGDFSTIFRGSWKTEGQKGPRVPLELPLQGAGMLGPYESFSDLGTIPRHLSYNSSWVEDTKTAEEARATPPTTEEVTLEEPHPSPSRIPAPPSAWRGRRATAGGGNMSMSAFKPITPGVGAATAAVTAATTAADMATEAGREPESETPLPWRSRAYGDSPQSPKCIM